MREDRECMGNLDLLPNFVVNLEQLWKTNSIWKQNNTPDFMTKIGKDRLNSSGMVFFVCLFNFTFAKNRSWVGVGCLSDRCVQTAPWLFSKSVIFIPGIGLRWNVLSKKEFRVLLVLMSLYFLEFLFKRKETEVSWRGLILSCSRALTNCEASFQDAVSSSGIQECSVQGPEGSGLTPSLCRRTEFWPQ